MCEMSFKNLVKKEEINESAVGKVGRTGKNDAESYINDNPQLIKDFKKMVIKKHLNHI
jgi:hypothetical protein